MIQTRSTYRAWALHPDPSHFKFNILIFLTTLAVPTLSTLISGELSTKPSPSSLLNLGPRRNLRLLNAAVSDQLSCGLILDSVCHLLVHQISSSTCSFAIRRSTGTPRRVRQSPKSGESEALVTRLSRSTHGQPLPEPNQST